MIRSTLYGITGLLIAVAVVIAVLWQLPQPSVAHDPSRDLPWKVPDHRLAEKGYEYLPDGRIQVITHHLPLPDVTPAMLSWFYRQLPISTVDLDGTTYPLYHLFHPTEHGRLFVLEPATDGSPGMGPGAVIMREEWFGDYDSRGAARMASFSDSGMTAVASVAGFEMGVIEHRYSVVNGETRYAVHATIGSTVPVLGTLLNSYLRSRVFTPGMIAQWMRHQVEEVGSLRYFLPQLYQQRPIDNHFTLTSEGLSQLQQYGR